jgi:hypothetical protein
MRAPIATDLALSCGADYWGFIRHDFSVSGGSGGGGTGIRSDAAIRRPVGHRRTFTTANHQLTVIISGQRLSYSG